MTVALLVAFRVHVHLLHLRSRGLATSFLCGHLLLRLGHVGRGSVTLVVLRALAFPRVSCHAHALRLQLSLVLDLFLHVADVL